MAKILVADDARIMRNILRVILEKNGHEVVGEAANGEEAVELYGELQPDLVTLDIHMEPMNGIDCLKKLRELDESARVLMVSAIGQQGKIDQALSLGALGYVTKPFQQNEIDWQIKKALES
jgi:two-component system chemotaxis response regulator CheY